MTTRELLEKQYLEKDDIKQLLATSGEEMQMLFHKAQEVKFSVLDNNVHLRGLIEYSNKCRKSCLYCGVRSNNTNIERYTLTDDEVVECAKLSHKLGYGSVAIQSGER
ncbi:MAG: [Bacteroidales bacterium]|nr:[FeFe] hydrogenase H-cluster radical SAM maturase HydE [Bacteroidales bacterium]